MQLKRRIAALEERLRGGSVEEQSRKEAEAYWNRACAEDPLLASMVDGMLRLAQSRTGHAFDRGVFSCRAGAPEWRQFHEAVLSASSGAELIADFVEHILCNRKNESSTQEIGRAHV